MPGVHANYYVLYSSIVCYSTPTVEACLYLHVPHGADRQGLLRAVDGWSYMSLCSMLDIGYMEVIV